MATPKEQDAGYWYSSSTVPENDEDFFEEVCNLQHETAMHI